MKENLTYLKYDNRTYRLLILQDCLTIMRSIPYNLSDMFKYQIQINKI